MDWLLVNPVSGSGRAMARVEEARAKFKKHGILFEEKSAGTIPQIQDMARAAANARVDRLWVLGGDGTLAAVAGCLCYSPTVLCPLPGGTVNVFCRELAIPTDPSEAITALLAGETIAIDVGQVAETKFLLMASVGIDAETVRDVHLGLKEWIGPAAYVVEGARKFFSFPAWKRRLTVTDEHGIDHFAYHAIVQNGRLYGGSIVMAPKAKLDDGRFDVLLLKKPGRLAILRFLFAVAAGTHIRLPYVEYFRSNTVHIQSDSADSVQADGDCLTKLPAHITLLPKALHVLSPHPPSGAK